MRISDILIARPRTRAELRDLNLTMAVQLAARIETELDATLGGLSLQLDGVRYLDDLALSLQANLIA